MKKTVLGVKRANPYSTAAMSAAYRSLYDSSARNLTTTDLYVKFIPNSLEDIKLLEESNLELSDFDLLYEVMEMGDYYQEPVGEELPVYYAVVPVDYEFPNVNHQLIENLYLDDSNPLLIGESYLLTGNTNEINKLSGFSYDELGDINRDYIITNGDLDCDPPCVIKYREIIANVNGRNHVIAEAYCDCTPPTNPTACSHYPSERKPAGRIRVEDTQLSTHGDPNTFLPVRQVNVILYDGWLTFKTTPTDNNGCWKIDSKFYGKAYIWVKFKNNLGRIRGMPNGIFNAYKTLLTIKNSVGTVHGPVFNNIIINYNMWTVQGSWAHLCWGAATVNNALYEYNTYAFQEGISTIQPSVDILIGRNFGAGYTLMGVQYYLAAQAAASITFGLYQWSNPIAISIGVTAGAVAIIYLPDVCIGINHANSDVIKETVYHEFAHVSHYYKAGFSLFKNLVEAEINAFMTTGDSHGDPTVSNAGLIAIYESWAEHVGLTFADMTYPLATNTSFIGNIRYIEHLERTWNEEQNHIPIGLYHDLIDGGSEPTSTDVFDNNSTNVIDDVSGFTNQQMFNCLTPGATNINNFRLNLITFYLANTSNTQSDVNLLFNSY